MAAMHWQLRHAVPAPDCDMTTAAFMGLKRAALPWLWRFSSFGQNYVYRYVEVEPEV